MSVRVNTTGFRELEAALKELGQSMGRSVLRRTLIRAGQPMITAMKSRVPVDSGKLRDSIKISSKLSPRQRRLHRAQYKNDKLAAEAFIGTGMLPHAHLQEFGTINHPPQPFARPAWDETKMTILSNIKTQLAEEIQKAAKRAARRSR